MGTSDISKLENVIKKIDHKDSTCQGKHFITIVEGTDEINPGVLRRLSGNTYLYRVYTDDAGQPTATGESDSILVKDPSTNNSVSLRVTYEVICPEGNQVQLVKSLGKNGDPDDALRSLITSAARKYLWDNGAAVFHGTGDSKEKVLTEISNKVQNETGLMFRGRVLLEHEEKLSTIHFDQSFEVRFKDTPELLGVHLQASLEVHPQKRLLAVIAISESHKLEDFVTSITKVYFESEVRSQDFLLEISSKMKETLTERLNAQLERFGRRTSGLSLRKSNNGTKPILEVQFSLSTNIPILGRNDPVVLNSKVHLTLKDYACFKDQGILNLQNWTEETFEKVVKRKCFECSYLDFLQPKRWRSLEEQIETEMDSEVEHIGYQVVQIFSSPILSEEDFMTQKTHRYYYENLTLKSSSNTKVKLDVFPTFIINNWEFENIVKKINQGINLNEDIYRLIKNTLETSLIKISPNRYYLEFEDMGEDGHSVSGDLSTSIQLSLKTEFGIDASVSINPHDNDDVNKVKNLISKPIRVDFSVIPHDGVEEVSFTVTVIVNELAPEGWGLVTRQDCSEISIKQEAANFLESEYAVIADYNLTFKNASQREMLRKLVQEKLSNHLSSIFGVHVRLENLSRQATDGEAAVRTHIISKVHEKIAASREKTKHQDQIIEGKRKNELLEIQTANKVINDDYDHFQTLKKLKAENNDLSPDDEDEYERLKTKYAKDEENISVNLNEGEDDTEISLSSLPFERNRKNAIAENRHKTISSNADTNSIIDESPLKET